MRNYRSRAYEEYGANFQDIEGSFDVVAARRYGKGYSYYLRDWLPEDKDASIAELGCGSGRILYLLLRNGYRNVRGVDISPQQVEIAKQVTDEVVCANALHYLENCEEHFDLLIALDLIEHLTKDEGLRLLDLCYAALKPGGRLILQTPNAGSPWGAQYRYADITHETSYTTGSLSVVLRLAGFGDLQYREKGPILWGYSLASSLRYVAWRGIRLWLMFWNLAEMGSAGVGVYTRIFLTSATKDV